MFPKTDINSVRALYRNESGTFIDDNGSVYDITWCDGRSKVTQLSKPFAERTYTPSIASFLFRA